MEQIRDFFNQHRRVVLVVGSLLFVLIMIGLVAWWRAATPVNLATNLSNASDATKQKAAEQMTVPISNLPAIVDATEKQYIENQLAYILRQKYGNETTSLTAVVRQAVGYDAAGNYLMYVDVPAKNESYSVLLNLQNNNASISCAPQDQQMNPSTSKCVDIAGVDNYSFPNG